MEEFCMFGVELEGKSMFDLFIEVMSYWLKGVDYFMIFVEINVVCCMFC